MKEQIVNIALALAFKSEFSYRLYSDEDNLIGRRVFVPFGKQIRTGIIVSENLQLRDTSKIKDVLEIIDEVPVFSKKMLEFTKWISDYYISSWGELLKAALPQGMARESIVKIRLYSDIEKEKLEKLKSRAPKRAKLIDALYGRLGYISIDSLAREIGEEDISSQIQALERAGVLDCSRVMDKLVSEKTQKAVSVKEELLKDENFAEDAIRSIERRAPKQALLLSQLYLYAKQGKNIFFLSEMQKEFAASSAIANALVAKNFLEMKEVEVDRSIIDNSEDNLSDKDESKFQLNEEQKDAYDSIKDAIYKDEFKTFLLYGVTGSGKTLVYLNAIKESLNKDQQVLFLLPEISLTPQLIDRFEKVFPEIIAVIHSRMSEGQRYDAWRSIEKNKAKILIGTRSALFAPFQNLGLIIVDEEHEKSLKQDQNNPKYHARDCAIMRAKLENAVMVLGSATPSFETMHNAETGKYKLLKLSERAKGVSLPKIEIVDTQAMKKEKLMFGSFSKPLLDKIIDRINKKEGIILFYNRRGFSNYLTCNDCADIPMCEHCSISLTYHKYKNQLRCHYCGYTIPAYKTCRACGHIGMEEVGSGTQKIEDELRSILERRNIEASIERVDLDTTVKKGSLRKILYKFSKGEIDILVGTQIVAKGLDFPNLTLVAVVNTDLHLFSADFRANERTFQLLTQVAGRAGRSEGNPGEVIIQTAHPDNEALKAVKKADFLEYYRKELEERRFNNYPPFVRFSIIEFSGKNQAKVNEHAHAFTSYLPSINSYLMVMGPNVPVIEKIRDKFRQRLILKNNKIDDPSGSKMRELIRFAKSEYEKNHASSSVYMSIDIDSFNA